MNAFRITLIVILLSIATTAMAAPAGENSIKQLLVVTQAQKLADNMQTQINLQMNNIIQQALKGKAPNAKQQKAISNMKNKVTTFMQKEFAWEKLGKMYIRLYKESFTEEEVTGMLSFYKTTAGKAVINKMPVLMQKSMQEIQSMISESIPQMQKIESNFAAEMKSASN